MQRKQVFEGIKVADFAWVGVGVMVSRELAEHGATVVRVECHRRPETLRMAGPFLDNKPGIDRSAFGMAFNTNKYNISLDLNTPKGQEAAKRLAMWSDIVTDGMTPGAMKKWGLDYESLKKIKPDIIMYSTCQQGQSGPYSHYGGYGTQAAMHAGFGHITGWPDREPTGVYGAYTDFISPWYLCTALIGALVRRRKTGKGMYLDQAQREAGVTFLGPAVLDYTVNGRILNRMGNRDPYAAPHSVYRCQGEDRWCAIAVGTDAEWQAFCKVIGEPEWTRNPKFTTLAGRKENEEELNRLTEEWTKDRTAEEVMEVMQAAGVPAGVVETCQDLFEDAQIKHRQHFVRLEHQVMGLRAYNAPPYRLSKTPAQLHRAPPCLGQDNEYVYKEILGYSDDEIADLLIEGVITTEADLPRIPGF